MPPNDNVTNGQLDRVLAQVQKATDGLMHLIDRNTDKTDEIVKDLAYLTAQVKEIRQDLHKVEEVVRGNGATGLSTKVELMDKEVAELKEKVKHDLFNTSSKKEKYAMYAAVGSGAIGGLYSAIERLLG